MGYYVAHGTCVGCGKLFSFNPHRVPSSSAVTGKREPICLNCFEEINRARAKQGMEPFSRHADAYEPVDENEGW